MKKSNIIRKISMIPMSIIMILVFTGIISCTGQNNDQKIFEAYELRINGHADSAKVLLEQFTGKNPENALGWYELCRTTEHIGRANPRAIQEMLDEALKYINLAVENDPENAWYYSYKGGLETLQFYFALQAGNENALSYLEKFEETYNSVFLLDPTYYENKLTLVEFFGGLPADMGGDLKKAEKYAKELEEADLVYGAKAREILMPEDADYVTYWKEILVKDIKNADVQQAMGRVYLFMEDIEKATEYYQKAIDIDPSKNVLYLDLGRFYMMKAMQSPAPIDSVEVFVENEFNKFLNFSPVPVAPMKAWAYGLLSMINRNMKNEDTAEKFSKLANELDPFYSRASGKPSQALYCPLDVIVHEQNYYLSPF